MHLEAAVAAGKNIFTEKPVPSTAQGSARCSRWPRRQEAKGLGVAAGTQRRHQTGYLETHEADPRRRDRRDRRRAMCYWNQGVSGRRIASPSWSDIEWQLRNWLYFTWLSGDHIVEQHVHNIDVINWAMGTHPVRAHGMGGRQVRTGPEWGHIFDHFSIDYEYPGNVHLQVKRDRSRDAKEVCRKRWSATAGSARWTSTSITGAKPWKFEAKDNAPYVQEHTDFIASLRAGSPLNELKNVAESTMTAIMGRMAAYTGQPVSWDQALNSSETLMPANLTFGPMQVPPVAIPGQTKLT